MELKEKLLRGLKVNPHERQNKVRITPNIAKTFLDLSHGNRTIRNYKIKEYKKAMKSGEFFYTGDVIRFLPDGSLYDGHHRLIACSESGAHFYTDLFVINYEAKTVVDVGTTRTPGDMLHFNYGLQSGKASLAAAMIKLIVKHDYKKITNWAAPGGAQLAFDVVSKLSVNGVDAWFNANMAEVLYSIEWVWDNLKRKDMLIPKSHITALHYLAVRKYNKQKVEDFLSKVFTGYDLVEGQTEDLCRSHLLVLGQQKVNKTPNHHKFYSVAKCLNSRLQGRELTSISSVPYKHGHQKIPRFDI